MGKGNASRTGTDQWWDVCKGFVALKAMVNSLAKYHVKLTAEQHRSQPGAAGRIIRELEVAMKEKVARLLHATGRTYMLY